MALADFPQNIGYSTCGLIIYVGLGVGGGIDGEVGSSPVPINIQVGGGVSPGLTLGGVVGGAVDEGGGVLGRGGGGMTII